MVNKDDTALLDFRLRTIEGEECTLDRWRGKVLLIVNTASECGFTPQYEGLESLYKQYMGRGLVVMGFPSNDFGKQEPGDNQEILSFCQTRYGVSFPLFEKGSVTGRDSQPLFNYLTNEANNDLSGKVKWNFEKFLVDSTGTLVDRFSSRTKPQSKRLIEAIERIV